MGPGRPTKPTAIKRLEGNPGKRPLNDLEPIPPGALPSVPEYFKKYEKQAWERMSSVLFHMKLLTVADRDMMEAYCISYATWRECNEDLKKNGNTLQIFHPNGELKYEQQRPQVAMANKALDQMTKIATQFGMTPASRSRLMVLPQDKDKPDNFEDLLA